MDDNIAAGPGSATPAPGSASDLLRQSAAVHDISQMLAVVIVRAELLLSRRPDPATATGLESILLAARDAVGMLQRLRGGPAAPGTGGTGAGRVVAEALQLVVTPDGEWSEPSPKRATGRWSCAVDLDPDRNLPLPPAVLREVLVNLLTNAVEAMPDGGRVAVRENVAVDRLELLVEDDGPGLATDAAERIFEAGFTSSNDATRGVGLAGCRLLLEDHGAELRCEPRPEGGSRFVIAMPAASAGTAAPDVPAGLAPVEPSGDDLRVLVVDDDAGVREMLRDVLGAFGCRAAVARNASEALAAQAADAADILLLDARLPGTSGLDLAVRLRENDARPVIVLMTGLGNEEVLERATDGPIDLTLVKPLDLDRLRELLGRSAVLLGQRAGHAAPSAEPSEPPTRKPRR